MGNIWNKVIYKWLFYLFDGGSHLYFCFAIIGGFQEIYNTELCRYPHISLNFEIYTLVYVVNIPGLLLIIFSKSIGDLIACAILVRVICHKSMCSNRQFPCNSFHGEHCSWEWEQWRQLCNTKYSIQRYV